MFYCPIIFKRLCTSRKYLYIDSDANFTRGNSVVGGSGATNDPYVIEGWDIKLTTDHLVSQSKIQLNILL